MTTTAPIPPGFHSVTPYLVVKGAAEAIEFYRAAFDADEVYRHTCEQSGLVTNAQLRIGNSMLMLNDEFPDMGCFGPSETNASPVTIHLYVEDADAVFDRAVAAGASVQMPVSDMFWGDRFGVVQDPYGHKWSIATRTEELAPDQIAERAKDFFG